MSVMRTFRLAGPADVPAIVALVQSAYRGDASRLGWTTEAELLDGQRTDEAEVSELLNRQGSRVVLATEEDILLGCCHVERRTEDVAYFGMFSVAPRLQGKGAGAALLAEAERRAVAWGCASMQLTVLVQRAELIAWYERRGYRRTGQLSPFPYGDERFGIPRRADLVFELLVKPLR